MRGHQVPDCAESVSITDTWPSYWLVRRNKGQRELFVLLFNYSCLSLEINPVLTGSELPWSQRRMVPVKQGESWIAQGDRSRPELLSVLGCRCRCARAEGLWSICAAPPLTGWGSCSGTLSVSNAACWLSLQPITYLLIESSVVQTDAFGLRQVL